MTFKPMKGFSEMLRLTCSALALSAMTLPALADVTPEQVWQAWVDYYQSVGYSVAEGSRDTAGQTLTVRDVLIAGGAEAGRMTFKVPQVALSSQGDGSVRTIFAEEIGGTVEGTEPEGDSYSVPMLVRLPGNAIITTGAPEDMTHQFDYPAIDLVVSQITNNGTETPMPMNFALKQAQGKIHMVPGAPAEYDYDLTFETLDFDGHLTDEEGGDVKFSGQVSGIESSGSMSTPGDFTNLDDEMDAALKAGLVMNGSFKAKSASSGFTYSGTNDEGKPSEGTGKLQGEGLEGGFSLSKQGMGYRMAASGNSFELTSPQIPFPLSYAVEKGSLDLLLPVSKGDEAQPFHFAYALGGVTMAEGIWNMFDPQAQLPRDPASLEINLSGLMKVVEDVFAPPADAAGETAPADGSDSATAEGVVPGAPADGAQAQAEADAMADEPSAFEPVEMKINTFAVDMLGAKVSATGELRAVEGGSIEAPVGRIQAEYHGIDKLLTTLGNIGLLPNEQMMGVRMMMSMFARPKEGDPETLTTDLEMKEGGEIFANGQRIK